MNPKHRIVKIGTVTTQKDGSLVAEGWVTNGEDSDAAGFDIGVNGRIVLIGGYTILELKAIADEALRETP